MIKRYKDFIPEIAADVFIAENATVVGEVFIDKQASIWYNAVLRGDVGSIHIGERSNIQDFVMVHCSGGKSITRIGKEVTVGHHATLHGCIVGDEVLVGIGATILDNAVIPDRCVVAAHALVPENKVLESGFLYAGIPAKKLKPLAEKHYEVIRRGAANYVHHAAVHRESEEVYPRIRS